MEKQALRADLREKTRKGANSLLRRQGKIPAVVYGGIEATPITVDEKEFATKFRNISESTIITMEIDGKPQEVLIKDYQENLINGKILHIDFYAVDQDRLLRSRVPLVLTGSALGAREGGIVETHLYELEVECLPRHLPSEVVLDVSDMEIGDTIHVTDLPDLEGVKFLNSPESVVISVILPRVEEEPEEVLDEEEMDADADAEVAEADDGEEAPETE